MEKFQPLETHSHIFGAQLNDLSAAETLDLQSQSHYALECDPHIHFKFFSTVTLPVRPRQETTKSVLKYGQSPLFRKKVCFSQPPKLYQLNSNLCYFSPKTLRDVWWLTWHLWLSLYFTVCIIPAGRTIKSRSDNVVLGSFLPPHSQMSFRLWVCGLVNNIGSSCCRLISSDHSRSKSICSNILAEGRKHGWKDAVEDLHGSLGLFSNWSRADHFAMAIPRVNFLTDNRMCAHEFVCVSVG